MDGIILWVRNEIVKFDLVEFFKDFVECVCINLDCDIRLIFFDLLKDFWKYLVCFYLNFSYCSYKIFGNELNNYFDFGVGNGYNY